VNDLLNFSFRYPRIYRGETNEEVGHLKNGKTFQIFCKETDFLKTEDKEHYIDHNGIKRLEFKTLRAKLKYYTYSDDMLNIVEALRKVKDEDNLLENSVLHYIIEYLWNRCKRFHYQTCFLYSLNMILFSMYSVEKKEQRVMEILIFLITLLFVLYEFAQLAHSSLKQYFSSGWNCVDIFGNSFIIAKIGLAWAGFSFESEESQWVTAIALFFGYIKWVSYFTIIDSTRNLVRLITQTVADMRSFVLILGFIIIGFSFIFVQFHEKDSDETVGGTMLYTYSILYGNYDFEDMKFPELLFLMLVAFALSVVLMNMLVSIMGDTFSNVKNRLKFTDSQAKLEMISEAIQVKRIFIKFGLRWYKEEETSTYLYVVREKDEQEKSNKQDKPQTQENKEKIIKKEPEKLINEELMDRIKKLIETDRNEIKAQIRAIKTEMQTEMSEVRQVIKKLRESEESNEEINPNQSVTEKIIGGSNPKDNELIIRESLIEEIDEGTISKGKQPDIKEIKINESKL